MSTDLVAALARVRERIADAGGDPDAVRLVAVTKGHPVEAVQAALAAGLLDLGESYAQELVAKADELAELRPEARVRWHAIGGLQRNKVRLLAPHVALWQSVDRLSLAGEIARRAPGALVLVQVNVSGAEQQGGCPPARVASVVEGCRDLGLEVRGLMAIGARGTEEEVRAGFRQVRELADGLELPERSMGMSGDLELAVAEGSTMVRVGTDLFGPRMGAAGVGQ
ncbi:MAG: YggS family pyridoxal phosphate-dependent enzyme [Acidimicrobiales bacterium]